MSYFGTCLDELLKRKNMKAVRLAEISGVSQPMISRYISGDQVWVSSEDLERLTTSISSDPGEQAELLRAHLLDESHGPGSKLINIEISGRQSLRESSPPYRAKIKLPDDLEQHLETIRAWVVRDPDVRNIVEGLGRLLSTEPSSSSKRSKGKRHKTPEELRDDAEIADLVEPGPQLEKPYSPSHSKPSHHK